MFKEFYFVIQHLNKVSIPLHEMYTDIDRAFQTCRLPAKRRHILRLAGRLETICQFYTDKPFSGKNTIFENISLWEMNLAGRFRKLPAI